MPHPLLRPLLRAVPTVAQVPHRAVLSVAGSQANEFLNGLLTSSVHEPIKPLYSAFLHAQGRVLYDVFLYTSTDTTTGKSNYLLEYDSQPSDAPPLLSLLKRYVLRSKVKITDVSAEYDVWAAWDDLTTSPSRKWVRSDSGVIQPVWNGHEWPWGTTEKIILDQRANGMGRRMLVRKGDLPPEASHSEVMSPHAYTLHRVLRGVPEGAVDIPPMQAFPMDSNLDVMGALEFRKGCYVGQELTVRTYHTGVVRKRILPVVIHDPNTTPTTVIVPAPTSPRVGKRDIRPAISEQIDGSRITPRPRGTGKLLTFFNGVGLALLRLEHVEGLEAGGLKLYVNIGENDNDGEHIMEVTHWWPDWWPQWPAP